MKPQEETQRHQPSRELPVMHERDGITLFYPYVPVRAIKAVEEVLKSRWIGEGPRVAQFEREFSSRFCRGREALAVGSGTDALHLAYILSGIKPGDEVICPVFTCTATNIPLLYVGAKIIFADVDPSTLNISVEHVAKLVNEKTKAIVCVHYGGLPCDLNELKRMAGPLGIPVIEDAAHAPGATYRGQPIGSISDFAAFSFQAVKQITTGDGGMLVLPEPLRRRGEDLRWFGINRVNKQNGTWDNDITEVGYKYQMTDIAAAMGLAALEEFDKTLAHRQQLMHGYTKGLNGVAGIQLLGTNVSDRTHAAWLCTATVERRKDFTRHLRENRIETGQVHYRNDRYSIFGGRRLNLPNMDTIEDRYTVLPLHMHLTEADVDYVCQVIRQGW
jgi:perosamine synthetase